MTARGYRVPDCQNELKCAFAEGLHERSQMTWLELEHAPRQGLGCERIPRDALRVAIPRGVTEDVQKFVVFRLRDQERLIGYRDGAVFQAVWLDATHRVYPG